ncbi:hypothetical protein [Oligella ureolytica]|uniref:Uncharacterized protein n=1 Tax=Oligella ureolytica TaxID=90244 RepID=A0A7T3BRZ1_9BURK|nr:hypothetical protein [Oligella ureolytica]QPT40763.1 hypothetical protein I6G29_04085 [Oligella ureolytica]
MLKLRRVVLSTAAVLSFLSVSSVQAEERAVCYNCPPEWADWKSELGKRSVNTCIYSLQNR